MIVLDSNVLSELMRPIPEPRVIAWLDRQPHASIWINKHDIVVAEWVPIGRVTLLKRVS